jgi:biopolymer transport protein ExbB/TolQ
LGNLLELLKQGGPAVWPILLCGIIGFAISIERLFYVYLRSAINTEKFMVLLQRLVMAGDIDGAVRLCNSEPSAALPQVMKAALIRAHRSEHEMSAAVEEATRAVTPRIGKYIGFLPMIANTSTLLGLLGTIQGLILSFESVAAATAEARSSELSHGIAVAMYATLFGLMVAIPVLVAHSVISSRANATLDDIDHYGLKLVNLLVARADEKGDAVQTSSLSEG